MPDPELLVHYSKLYRPFLALKRLRATPKHIRSFEIWSLYTAIASPSSLGLGVATIMGLASLEEYTMRSKSSPYLGLILFGAQPLSQRSPTSMTVLPMFQSEHELSLSSNTMSLTLFLGLGTCCVWVSGLNAKVMLSMPPAY
ncbi:hypothetical protein BDP27DRAFT_1060401 [Rhodocollybia butyracea]|uniref:Uncharacterized protein n=1 Tax=Rhodocollybia butyracea TaxID=206335 RepID=A0A9P5U4V2_9AGAR|nr:hypothetical protein BDP27DRAFT_1060401 [Rhodocollybia butyracea]